MNTPKTFVPVVTEAMEIASYDFRDAQPLSDYGRQRVAEDSEVFAVMAAHPDFQRQLRAYAAEVARAMVGTKDGSFGYWADGYNACRAATLSAIDEWEKNDE